MGKLAAALALCLALPPTAGIAGDRIRAERGFQSVGTFPPHGVFPASQGVHRQPAHVRPGHAAGSVHHHHGKGHHHGRFHHRHVAPQLPYSVFYYAPPVAYSPPAVVSPSIVVNSSPTVYAPIVMYAPAPAPMASAPPAAAPMPTVVEYSTGRYELRGDGSTAPYVWVWIPNPPLGPPPQAAEERPARSASRETSSTVYRWTDEDGTMIWTNRADAVPERHR